ncbi:MAG: LysM peptidoglycan-binding domain-containing protein, partial [Lachnospiraceae bacterium]|nr:LysM peptidoglycan-binding domain-containing protein [Lachnospiraceae bacterium]
MRLFQGKTVMRFLIGLLVLSNPIVVQAYEDSSYKTRYDIPTEEQDDYTVITQSLGEYEVCEGDNLWNISERLLGNSDYYLQIAEQNADVIADPDLIYPQMHLQIKRNVYVKKRTGINGIKTPEYRFG